MFSIKSIVLLPFLALGLMGANVSAQNEEILGGICLGGPATTIYCDNNYGLKETKAVQTYRGNTKLIYKVSCRGTGVAYACFNVDFEELVGFSIMGDDYAPVCETFLAINEMATKYEVTCKGDGFRVDTTLRIKED